MAGWSLSAIRPAAYDRRRPRRVVSIWQANEPLVTNGRVVPHCGLPTLLSIFEPKQLSGSTKLLCPGWLASPAKILRISKLAPAMRRSDDTRITRLVIRRFQAADAGCDGILERSARHLTFSIVERYTTRQHWGNWWVYVFALLWAGAYCGARVL